VNRKLGSVRLGVESLERRELLSVSAGLASHHPAAVHHSPGAPPTHLTVAQAIDQFTTDLYAQLARQPGNLALSPFSIETALAMAYAGAGGKTADQMASVLHLGPDNSATHAAFGTLIQKIVADGSVAGSTLNTANALWGQAGFPFKSAFLKLLDHAYHAPLQKIDFKGNPDQAAAAINNWVAQQTQGKIQGLFPPGSIDPLTRLVLANAIYFHGTWSSPFDPSRTSPENFTLSSGNTVQVPMMHQETEFAYTNQDGVQVLEMPYIGGRLAMDVLLPDHINGLPTLDNQLTATNLQQWMANLAITEVELTLPKFQVTSTFSLPSILAAMGMRDAFNAKTANFSRMNGSHEPLHISAIVHQANVNVDETGTVAAAATGVGVGSTATVSGPAPIIFNADHPFAYLIRDLRTNTVLFVGRVSDPSQTS
jgi:serpin B